MCSSMKALRRCCRSLTLAEYSKCIGFLLTVSLGKPRRQASQRCGALAEIREARVLRLAAMEPAVDLLDDHAEFEHAEHLVVSDVGHVAAGQLGIARNELVAGVPAGACGQGGYAGDANFLLRGPHPVTERQAEIGEGIADG